MARKLVLLILLLVATAASGQVSTANERLAVLGWGGVGSLWNLPVSSDGIGQDDKQQLLGGYPGVDWASPSPADDIGISSTGLFGGGSRFVVVMTRVSMVSGLFAANVLLWFGVLIIVARLWAWHRRTPPKWDREQTIRYSKLDLKE